MSEDTGIAPGMQPLIELQQNVQDMSLALDQQSQSFENDSVRVVMSAAGSLREISFDEGSFPRLAALCNDARANVSRLSSELASQRVKHMQFPKQLPWKDRVPFIAKEVEAMKDELRLLEISFHADNWTVRMNRAGEFLEVTSTYPQDSWTSVLPHLLNTAVVWSMEQTNLALKSIVDALPKK